MNRLNVRYILTALCLLLFSAATAFSQQFSPPGVNRIKIKIDTTWKFNLGDVPNAQTTSYIDAAWSTVHCPHTFQYVVPMNGFPTRTIGWYRKHFTLKSAYAGRKVTLFFEGALTVAQVWVNGNVLSTHYGGYNPFCYEISTYCNFTGADNVIAIRVDNSYQNQVPPEKPDGSFVDYCQFGGIYRDVYLIVTDNVYIPEAIHDWSNGFASQGGQVITYPGVSASAATLRVETWIRNTSGAAAACRLVTSLVDAQNAVVQSVETSGSAGTTGVTKFTQTMSVSNPRLWYPYDIPYRYTLYTVVYNGTTAVDLYRTKIGIRQMTWTKTQGMYCNGQSIKILGLNRHQNWPYVGGAVPNIQQVGDAVLLKEGGCNFIRCSHYLQDDAFLNACDSLGILLWIEVPAWGTSFTPNITMQPWTSRCQEASRSNIRHTRNHPSVVIWGAGLNEAWQNVVFDDTLQTTAKQEDTTHPTTQARNYSTANNVFDLYGGNWFTSVPTSNPDPNTLGFLISEHTGHTYPTRRADPETTLIEHALRHEQMTMWTRQQTFVHGNNGWCAFDYNTNGTAEDGSIHAHGAMDLMHIPKFCYYFYKSQCAQDNYDGTKHPMVFIENFYLAASPVNRKVFTNCDSVRLYRNGTLIGTQIPDKAGNACAHPPVTFTNVAFVSGNLRADGLIAGAVVASHTVRTPGTAVQIVLTADPDTIEANGGDFSRVIAQVVDNNGTVIPTATNSVTFTLSGSGVLIGQNPINTIRGQTIILAKGRLTAGTITVSATSGALPSTPVPIVLKPMAPDEDWTGTVVTPPKQQYYSVRRVEKMFGSRLCRHSRLFLPDRAPDGKKSIAVYDLAGTCIYKGIIRNRIIDFHKAGVTADKVYIVQIQDIHYPSVRIP